MNFNKNKGFTLYEVIIAIGLLSICSITILQFFIFSNEVNSKARNIDLSNNIVTNYIEEARNLTNSRDLFGLESPYIEEDSDDNNKNELSILEYYDRDFNLLPSDYDSQNQIIVPEGAKFVLTLNFNYSDYQGQYVVESFSDKGDIVNSPYEGVLFTFNAIMHEYNYDTGEIGDELSNLSTSRYFVE